MKVAIISDLHENFHNLIRAIESFETYDIEQILCLGDLMNAGLAKVLGAQDIPVYLIWGNNDGEKVDIVRTSYRENSSLSVSLNVYDFINIDQRKIFISHYDDLAHPMARSGDFDAVFYGHNHLKKVEKINDTWVVNPGELCAQKTGVCSYAIYDTTNNSVEIIELDNIISLKSEFVDDYFKRNMDKLGFRSKDSFLINNKKG